MLGWSFPMMGSARSVASGVPEWQPFTDTIVDTTPTVNKQRAAPVYNGAGEWTFRPLNPTTTGIRDGTNEGNFYTVLPEDMVGYANGNWLLTRVRSTYTPTVANQFTWCGLFGSKTGWTYGIAMGLKSFVGGMVGNRADGTSDTGVGGSLYPVGNPEFIGAYFARVPPSSAGSPIVPPGIASVNWAQGAGAYSGGSESTDATNYGNGVAAPAKTGFGFGNDTSGQAMDDASAFFEYYWIDNSGAWTELTDADLDSTTPIRDLNGIAAGATLSYNSTDGFVITNIPAKTGIMSVIYACAAWKFTNWPAGWRGDGTQSLAFKIVPTQFASGSRRIFGMGWADNGGVVDTSARRGAMIGFCPTADPTSLRLGAAQTFATANWLASASATGTTAAEFQGICYCGEVPIPGDAWGTKSTCFGGGILGVSMSPGNTAVPSAVRPIIGTGGGAGDPAMLLCLGQDAATTVVDTLSAKVYYKVVEHPKLYQE